MENFIYYAPTKVFFGKDEENKIGEIIKGYNFKNILIHYGQSSVVKSGLLDKIKNILDKENIKYFLLGGVLPNPELWMVEKGVEICKKQNIDFILAIGGGSVIDSSKAIANGAKVSFSPWEFNLGLKTPKEALKVGVILTIAAAGSEMSQSCVITNQETHQKRGFNSETNRPLFAICNPTLTYSVNKYQTACGIVDILMHTLERFYSISQNGELVDYLSIGLFKAVVKAGEVAYDNPNDYEARATLMWASSLSHNGLTGVGRNVTMPVHQLEHELSGLYPNIAHGAGLAALYCSWARYVYKYDMRRFLMFAKEVMGVDDALLGISKLEEFFKKLGMPTSLKELNISTNDLELLAKNFTFDGKRTLKDIKEIGYQEALEIYKMAF